MNPDTIKKIFPLIAERDKARATLERIRAAAGFDVVVKPSRDASSDRVGILTLVDVAADVIRAALVADCTARLDAIEAELTAAGVSLHDEGRVGQ